MHKNVLGDKELCFSKAAACNVEIYQITVVRIKTNTGSPQLMMVIGTI